MNLEVKNEQLSGSSSNDEDEEVENEKSSLDDVLMEKNDSACGDQPPKSKYKKKRKFCTKCDKSFSKREYLSKHMRVEHNLELEKIKPGRVPLILKMPTGENDPRPYKCDQCEKEYIKSKHLSRHRRIHLKQYCNECKVPITTNYPEHMLKMHNYEIPRPFECPNEKCKKTFRTRANLSAHMRIHRVENRTYKCTVPMCPKSFFFSTDLRKHMKSHSLERSVICDICGDALKTSDTLKSHMRIHTGERPFVCSQCPRAFSTSNSLDIHTRTHTGEKPFKCNADGCQKSFSDTSTLQVHKRLHTNENPFQCHLCNRRTKQASNLRSHYKHFHRNNDITGRQIRHNSRIFSRYSQQEIEQHLGEYGDLMVLLEKGLTEYNREQNEKNNEITNALRLATAALTKTTSDSKGLTKESKLATLRRNYKPAIETFVIPTVKKGEIIETKPSSDILVKCEIPVQTIKTEQEAIKHDSPSNDGLFNIERVFIDAADEFPPADCDKVNIKEEFSNLDGFEAYANHDNDLDDDFEYDDPSSLEEIKCEKLQPNFEIKKNDETPDKIVKNIETQPQPAVEKRVRYSVQLEVNSRQRKTPDKISRRCTICNKSFHHLLRHIAETHSDIERPFECFICQMTYKRFEHLKCHMVKHGDIKDYICQHCGLAFFLNSELRKHIFNRHSTDRPFVCKTCRKCFKSRRGLTVHERTHENLKPFSCTTCQTVSFSTLGALKIHERKHTGEKPFQCNICQKNFSDSSVLRQHVRIHTGDKPYKCLICDRRTTQAGNLKSHYRHYHKLLVKHVSMFHEEAHQSTLTDPSNMIPLTMANTSLRFEE